LLQGHLAATAGPSKGACEIAELRAEGKTRSEFSNDYAAFLPYALHLGASFVTCNPPLVDIAWQADPRRWNAVADRLLAADPTAGGDDLARQLTLEVVLSNMHLLRPIFLLPAVDGLRSRQIRAVRRADSMIVTPDPSIRNFGGA
jgi:hypothetical protein